MIPEPSQLLHVQSELQIDNDVLIRFERNASLIPNGIALAHPYGTITYAELNSEANKLANYLLSIGVNTGSSVCLLLNPAPAINITLIALLKIGAIYIPLDTEHPPTRLQSLVERLNPSLILSKTSFTHLLGDKYSGRILDIDDQHQWNKCDDNNLRLNLDADLPAYVFFTSGTTGVPKAVVATRENLNHYVTSAILTFGMDNDTVMPTVARTTFSISLFELLCPLVAGGTVKIIPRDMVTDIPKMVGMLPELTMFHMGPSLLRLLVNFIKSNNLPSEIFSGLRHVSSGGDTVKTDLLADMINCFSHAEIFVIYGCTELSCMVTYQQVTENTIPENPVIGIPFPGVSVQIVNENNEATDYPDWGELLVAGAGVTTGYLDNPEETKAKYIEIDNKRFYRTGDLVRKKSDTLQYLGRKDFQVQLHGIRIELGEVETHLSSAPYVKEAVATGRLTDTGETYLVAYLVLEKSGNVVLDSIKRHLEQHLPRYMVPSLFVELSALPLNHNFKLDRRALPEPNNANTLRQDTIRVLPATPVEQTLLSMWKGLFANDDIGVTHNFFDLNGDSLQAIELLTAIKHRFSIQLPLSAFLTSPTIRSLAKIIESTRETTPPCSDLFTMKSGTGDSNVFLIHGALVYKELSEHIHNKHTVSALYQNNEAFSIGADDFTGLLSNYGSISEIACRYLDAIKQQQPKGPYFFVGFSIGGLIALEMCQILNSTTGEYSQVILIDTHLPGISKQAFFRKVLYHGKSVFTQGLPHLQYLAWKTGMQLRSRLSNKPSKKHDRKTMEELRRQARNHAAAFYEPRVLPNEVVLFKAGSRAKYDIQDDYLGWQEYLPNLTLFNLSGGHDDLLTGFNAVKIAALINKYCSEAH